MRIKDNKGKKAEMVFLIVASVLTIALAAYVLWLVTRLVAKADKVFTLDQNAGDGIPVFNFKKYEELFGPIASSTFVSPPPAASTSSKP